MQRPGALLLTTATLIALASAAAFNADQSAVDGIHIVTAKYGGRALSHLNNSLSKSSANLVGNAAKNESEQIVTRTKRLTSFGRPAETAPVVPKQGKGRECKNDTDCGPIPHTSCLADTRDGKKRCLCVDYTAPNNGICKRKNRVKRAYVPPGNINRNKKGLYERCESDADCLEGGECRKNGNATTTALKSALICQCQPGLIEDKGTCNGSPDMIGNYMAVLMTSFAVILRFAPN